MKNKKTKIGMIFVISLLAIFLVFFFSLFAIRRSVKIPAEVKSEFIKITAPVPGFVKEINIEAYRFVQEDQLLIGLENPEIEMELARLQEERSKLELLYQEEVAGDKLALKIIGLKEDRYRQENRFIELENNLIDLENRLELQTEKLQIAEQEYIVLQKLLKENKINRTEFISRSENYHIINNDIRRMKNEEKLLKARLDATEEEIFNLQKSIDLYKNNATLSAGNIILDLENMITRQIKLESQIEKLSILSSVSGIVDRIPLSVGQYVKTGEELMSISTEKEYWLITLGNSYVKRRVQPGNKVKIFNSDGETLWGRVTSVSPKMMTVMKSELGKDEQKPKAIIRIDFEEMQKAVSSFTFGERILVRIYF